MPVCIILYYPHISRFTILLCTIRHLVVRFFTLHLRVARVIFFFRPLQPSFIAKCRNGISNKLLACEPRSLILSSVDIAKPRRGAEVLEVLAVSFEDLGESWRGYESDAELFEIRFCFIRVPITKAGAMTMARLPGYDRVCGMDDLDTIVSEIEMATRCVVGISAK